MSRRICNNPDCDGGFSWMSDRWARHHAGISGLEDHEIGPEEWALYRARLNTVSICTTCGARPVPASPMSATGWA